ncbi:MAG: outer membrane beta-barrel protein [Bradyrhizobium sp.]
MKRILLTTVSLGVLGLLSPVYGADLPTYSKAPVLRAAVYDWSGFYVGVFGGGGYGNHNVNDAFGNTGAANFTANYSSTGGVGGGEAGYNWQSGSYLVGLEGDVFWSGIKGNDASASPRAPFPSSRSIRIIFAGGGTVRVRSGFTVDRWLMFFTGGYAFGDIAHSNTDPVLGVDRFTVHANGLTAGAGFAYAITNNVIGKFEYRYYNFNGYNRAGTPLTVNGQLPYTTESTYSVVTIGLDFKFGGPVVAKY